MSEIAAADALYEIEREFVSGFAHATTDEAWGKVANDAMAMIGPDMLTDPTLSRLYDILRVRFSQGEPTVTADILLDLESAGLDRETCSQVLFAGFTAGIVPHYAGKILQGYRARKQYELLRRGVLEADKDLQAGGVKAKRIAERLSMRLLEVFADTGSGQAQNLLDMLHAEREAMEREADIEIPVPFPKLNHVFGPLVPGDVVGLSAFSGGGKSTVAANLTNGWISRGVPVLAFPTEMRQRWLARLACLRAGVPQWIAEKRQWKKASPEHKAAYRATLADLEHLPLEIVNRPDISPAEIVTAARVIRKRWAGRPIVVVVDHAHRLNYSGEDANDAVGPATKMFKDFAGDDRDGGLVFLVLYQPRKPGGVETMHRPVAAAEIRGNSMVWNELDVHLSPFRMWVKASEVHSTEWGTPAAARDAAGLVIPAKPNAEGAKLDDEHAYFTVDKRRIGGDYSKVLSLDFDYPCGRMYESAPEPEMREVA